MAKSAFQTLFDSIDPDVLDIRVNIIRTYVSAPLFNAVAEFADKLSDVAGGPAQVSMGPVEGFTIRPNGQDIRITWPASAKILKL
jgi:hypothetical protein